MIQLTLRVKEEGQKLDLLSHPIITNLYFYWENMEKVK